MVLKLLPDQIADISYTNFIKDPLNIIKDVYAKLGIDMNIETENKMKQYLINQSNIQKQHSLNLRSKPGVGVKFP